MTLNRSIEKAGTEESALKKIAEWWSRELRKICENRECGECPYRMICPDVKEDGR